MGAAFEKSLRGIAFAVLVVTGAMTTTACGGDDDNAVPGANGTSSGQNGSSGSSGSADAAAPDAAAADGGATETAATPTFNPPAGTFKAAQSVVISSATKGATIFYTLDGTNPTPASVVYSAPIAIAASSTIRAFAAVTGLQNSPVAVATYAIDIPEGVTAPVQATPASGEYNNPVAVGLATTTVGSAVCYTLDGTTPTCQNGSCSGTASTYSAGSPIPVDAPVGGGSLVVKAIACSQGRSSSAVTTSTYGFRAARPTANTTPAEVALDTNVTIATATAPSGANAVTLRWNNNGTAPSCVLSEQTATGPATNVRVTKNTTYDVIACRPNYQASAIGTFAYTVKLTTPSLAPLGGTFDNDVAVTRVNGAAPSPALPAPAAPVLPGTGTPATGTTCYAIGADPICDAAGTGCASGATSPPTVTGNDANEVRARSCRPSFTPSNVVRATYTLAVAPIAVNRTNGESGPGFAPPYDPLATQNSWDPAATGSADFAFETATSGETIRWTTNDSAPFPSCGAAFDCAAGNPNACSIGAAATGIAPFTTIRAVACKPNYRDSAQRTIVYADPTQVVSLSDNRPNGIYEDDIEVTLTATPADATICYTSGVTVPADPVCSIVTGACTTGSTYDASAKPTITVTGTTFKAIACKSGVPVASTRITHLYTLQVATPTFTPAGAVVGLEAPITWSSTTSGATYRYSRSDASPNAVDPTCATGTAASGISEFDNDCNDANGTSCTPTETFKVIGCKTGYLASAIATQTFSATLNAPTLSPNGNPTSGNPWYASQQTVAIGHELLGQGVPGGKVCFATGGGTPACNADASCGGTGDVQQFTNAPANIVVNVDGTLVRAIACATGYAPSPLTEATYAFRVAPYTVTPAPGGQSTAVSVAFVNGETDSTGGATTICYTTNGNDISTTCAAAGVSCSAPLASGETWSPAPLQNIGTSVSQLKSRACRAGFVPTEQRNDAFTFGPYERTITIDGTEDFVAGENRLRVANVTRTSELASQSLFVSWDAANVYVGYRGDLVALESDRYFHFYVRGAGATTTSRDALVGDANAFGDDASWDSATGVNWHFYFRTDGGLEGVRRYTGTWGFPVAAPTYSVATGGALGTGTAYIEYGISRASLGLTGTGAHLLFTGAIWDASSPSARGRFPSNGYDVPAGRAWDHKFLDADLGAANLPTFGSAQPTIPAGAGYIFAASPL